MKSTNPANLILIILCILLVSAATTASAETFSLDYTDVLYEGYLSYISTNQDWGTLHNAPSATHISTDAYPQPQVRAGTTTNKWSYITRSFVVFDTSGLPDGYTFFDCYLHVTVYNIYTTLPNQYLRITQFVPDDPDNIDKEDYTNGKWINIGSGDSLLSGYSDEAEYIIEIPDVLINKTGYTIIGFQIASDSDDITPTWGSGQRAEIDFYNGATSESYWISINGTVATPTPTPTPYPGDISVNLLEKYSNAALVNQAITLTPTAGGSGETKTSMYGETLHFGVVPGMEYWFNATRAGYQDYNETYTIPASPGIYNVYMERILPPIANHSYAHFSVVDQTNGGLIPNAEIRLSDGQTKLTNSAGYAWFSVNNSEQINYYVSKPSGYWPAYGAMNLTADESILVALQRYTGPTATATIPGWTPITVPTTGTGSGPVVTLSAQLREQNVQEGMDVWYTNLPFISQFLFLLFIIGGLGLMAGGTRRN